MCNRRSLCVKTPVGEGRRRDGPPSPALLPDLVKPRPPRPWVRLRGRGRSKGEGEGGRPGPQGGGTLREDGAGLERERVVGT